MNYDYNIVSIGAGAAGLVTSYIGAATKAKVALIEKHKMGGDCLNTGCVPSKALIKSAKVVAGMRKMAQFGVEDVSFKVNFAKVMDEVQNVIKKIEPHDSIERYSGLGVDCITGEAKIISDHEVEVNGKVITARNIVIATGARPFVPPIEGIESTDYLHSDNIWDIREQPKRMLMLGGGPIGCELAQSFARLGTKVTIIDMMGRILPKEDKDITAFVENSMKEDGVDFILNAGIKRFEKSATGIKVFYEVGGKASELEFDKLMVSAGRQARVTGFGLEELGIELNRDGTIKVDDYLRTSVKNIYACGDVAGPYQFTHMASHQAWYCAVNSLAAPFKKFAVDYSCVPWVTFTDPEVARVGLSEDEAKEKNIPYEVVTYGLDDLDRAIAEREDKGLIKVLTPKGRDKILGATIVGSHAGDLLAEFTLCKKHNMGLKKIMGTIHPYPTWSEATKFTAGNWAKANAPETLIKYAESFSQFMR